MENRTLGLREQLQSTRRCSTLAHRLPDVGTRKHDNTRAVVLVGV